MYLVSARRRYRALADMSQDIDRVLHGLDSQTIAACDEGELAILSSEIRKMTVRLRQAADSQHRERMQLADAMADISPPTADAFDSHQPDAVHAGDGRGCRNRSAGHFCRSCGGW